METITKFQPLPPPSVPSQALGRNGWYLNSENLRALNSRLATENQAREVWRLLSLRPAGEVMRWMNSRRQNISSAPPNDLGGGEPVKMEEEIVKVKNEPNEPEEPEEEGGREQRGQEGGMLISSRNDSQAGGTNRTNRAGRGQVHEAPITTNPPPQWQQNSFTVRVGCIIRDRSDPNYWNAATRLFTTPGTRGSNQEAERFVVTPTFALSFSSPIISIGPSPQLDINRQMMHGESSTHPPPSYVSPHNRWIDQTAPLPPRDPRQRSQSAPTVRAMEEVIHRVVYTMAREFEQKAGLPLGGITNVFVKLGIGEE